MKNFEERCFAWSSSALKSETLGFSPRTGAVVAFPGWRAQGIACESHRLAGSLRRIRGLLCETEMVRALRDGSARGAAYGFVEPWQAVVVGGVCAASSLVAIIATF
ncbi:hypothetical protein B5F40_03325 [Gordonibacter sp. An230]|nr:hypothetical protein B5F40_03325 [Gordonibacter sp. An230]